MNRANSTCDKEKQKPIPQSISAAALMLIAWVREQMPTGEANKAKCQQSHGKDCHYETKRNSR